MLDREFGKYRLLRRLGRGGMADVYLARDTERGVEVALKLVEVRADRDSRDICDAERRGALLQEQFSLVDAHVPQVHAHGTIDGHFYIDMEYVEGEDLAERIARGPLPAAEAASIASSICGFLEKAHAFEATLDDRRIRGIIHGDIKPKNVRLNLDGQVKILDFGIAKGLALSRRLTRNDFGSLTYLSPERLDTGEVDAHVDFWSVGVLLYEMVAGAPPFQADTSPALEALIRSRQAPAPLPESCPPALARIVLKMLSGAVSRRYTDAALIRHDLDAFGRGEPTTADAEWMASQPGDDETRRTEAPSDAAGSDREVTRRTEAGSAGPRGEDPEATRRTAARGVDGPAEPSTTPAVVPAAGPAAGPPRPRERARRWFTGVMALVAIVLVINEAGVWTAARRIRVGLATGQNAEMHALWDEYQGLTRRSLLRVGLVGVKGAMKERLSAQADRVIADYRQDSPTVREAQWREAATWLTDVLYLDPGDRSATARLRYCEGHLQRIDGEARKRKKLSASEALRNAVARFEEAARVDTRWPDPYLGLARTYIYGLDDLDRANAALKEAERRGYRPGNRELVQAADGYRSRAERWRREAAAVRGLDQEHECLERSADDFRQALDLYRRAIGFGEAGASVRAVQARLDEVEKQLDR